LFLRIKTKGISHRFSQIYTEVKAKNKKQEARDKKKELLSQT